MILKKFNSETKNKAEYVENRSAKCAKEHKFSKANLKRKIMRNVE